LIPDRTIHFRHQVWQVLTQHGRAARQHLVHTRRFCLERRNTVQHMMGINRLHRVHVGCCRVANHDGSPNRR
jgi:hypothetical protein